MTHLEFIKQELSKGKTFYDMVIKRDFSVAYLKRIAHENGIVKCGDFDYCKYCINDTYNNSNCVSAYTKLAKEVSKSICVGATETFIKKRKQLAKKEGKLI